jgi:hypothetical protein
MKFPASASALLAALILLPLMPGCAPPAQPQAKTPLKPKTPRALYQQITNGMTRIQVEQLLGDANSSFYTDNLPPWNLLITAENLPGFSAWYLPAPKLERNESPYAFGSIKILYDTNFVVLGKQLNPQVRD